MAKFINSYQELESSLRFKRKNPGIIDYSFKEGGRLKFEGEHGIFDQARNHFFNRFSMPKNDMEMVDTILNTIDAKEVSLEQYLSPHNTLPIEGNQTIGGLPEQIATSPASEPAGSMTGGAHSPSSIPRFQTPKIAPSVTRFSKNIVSKASISSSRLGSRITQGLGNMVGGGGSWLGRSGIKVADGVANRLNTLSSTRNRIRTPSVGKGKLAWALFGILFLAVFGAAISSSLQGSSRGVPQKITINLAGPGGCTDSCKADNDQEITYEITLSYTGTGLADIEVFGSLPEGISLPRADSEKWTITPSTFSQIVSDLPNKQTTKLTLTFKPDGSKTDFWATHFVTAKITKETISLDQFAIGGNEPANDDNCAGKYTSQIANNLSHKNFGDPTCTYDDDVLYALLEQLDPDQAPFWWLLVDCESTYRPNITNSSATDTAGAWGLFQMGRGKNGPLDHGDVPWIKQISNAISYKNSLENGPPKSRFKGEESYWACARPGGLKTTANKPVPKI